MFLSASLALLTCGVVQQATPQPVYRPRADYAPNNRYTTLEISKIEGTYEPFYHRTEKESDCTGSRITIKLTITNTGKTAVQLPDMILYEANAKKPWMTTDQVVDLPLGERTQTGGAIYLRPEQRKTLKPGESTVVEDYPFIPLGPWNPMKVEARLCQRILDEFQFVGHRTPARATLALNAPNYHPQKGMFAFKGIDGKPLDQAIRWQGAGYFQCEGTPVGGPVEVHATIRRKGSNSIAISGGNAWEEHSGTVYLVIKETVARHPIDWTRGEFSIKVGCPKHGMTRTLTDANPSDDLMIFEATVANADGS